MLRHDRPGTRPIVGAAGALAKGHHSTHRHVVKPAQGSQLPRRRAGHHARSRRAAVERLEARVLLSVGPEEQLFVYLLNRARHDPVAYQQEQSLSVDLSSVAPRPPLAVNDQLFASASFHAEEMAGHNYFGHQSQVTGDWPNKMARDQGYPLPSQLPLDDLIYLLPDNSNQIESLAAGTATAPATLNLLLVDQNVSPPGHRMHLLGIDAFHALDREVGVGHAYSAASTYKHYWAIHATLASTHDQFLTGVVFHDANGNSRYDLNEGLGGVTVTAGTATTTTNAGGGWALPVTDGTYLVSASGGSFVGTGSVPVVVQGSNVEADFVSGLSTGYVDFSLSGNTVHKPIWQNPRHPCDITGDGFIKPDDVLTLINDLNSKGARDLNTASPATPPPPPFLDPSGDGEIGAIDVLTVINYLNMYGPGPVPAASGGEGERGHRIDVDGRAAPPPPAGGTSGTLGLDSGTSTIVASAAPSRGQRPEWPAALQPASSTVSKAVRTRIVWDALLDERFETSELEEAISVISQEIAHD